MQFAYEKKMFKINEVAEEFNVNPNVLRFYEKKKLLTPARNDNGYRMYSIEDILQFNNCRSRRNSRKGHRFIEAWNTLKI
jgi:DNA-binding transcriptional MerR regulator